MLPEESGFTEKVIDKIANKVSQKIIEQTEPIISSIYKEIMSSIFDLISICLLCLIIYTIFCIIMRKKYVKLPFIESEAIGLLFFSSIFYIIIRLSMAVI
jgi:hypothetical protein